ncbi:PP2C family protein-serine/threonine phosphatase [Extensimonas sp. H3M7-6]|uniref:PP2C family protein-serine/threonine phosphatase n=1 Tax=Extensimonas soli TaxID=3031322 RepID=UPI0023DBF099|nr:protein phosphatase 2C domain-containing protein [Extensimonas sp. H3M7-6]MDF1480615.1 protein phosphatase 2C domain-containing protein [Extensimonas sp. H3M7-6]
MAASSDILRIAAFQQIMRPAYLHHTMQQDALVLQTIHRKRHIQQKPMGQWDCVAPGGIAWLSVADGVASSPCADLASRSFLQVLHPERLATPLSARQLPALVRQARLNWRAQHLRPHTRGAACTLASLLYSDGQVCAVNSGDARIWRLRPQIDGGVQWLQLSRDHTVWQQMLDDGDAEAGQADAYASMYQGLLHCLVLDADEDPNEDCTEQEDWLHIWHGRAEPGDAYLLATDGLHSVLSDVQMQAIWGAANSPQEGLRALHSAFRRNGAQDDISVVLLHSGKHCKKFKSDSC